MNPKVIFGVALLTTVLAVVDSIGTIVTSGAAVTLPLLALTNNPGVLATALSAIGALKLGAAALALAGIGIGAKLKKGTDDGYGAPVSTGYGAPSVGVSSGYGAPSGGVSSGYGAPSVDVSSGYGAPSVSSVSSGYGAPSGGSVSSSYGAPSGGVSSSYGAPSSSYGAPRSSRYHKRSTETFVPDEEAIFSLVASLDVHSCGKLLVCELEAKEAGSLEEDEILMLSLFGNYHQAKKVDPKSPKAEYDLAAELGLITKDQIKCRRRYRACPYTAVELMLALRQSNL